MEQLDAKCDFEFCFEIALISEVKGRARRAASGPLLNTCPLLLVADWKFYQKTGQNSLIRTTNYLVKKLHIIFFLIKIIVFHIFVGVKNIDT